MTACRTTQRAPLVRRRTPTLGDAERVCAQVYRTVETTIPLGSRFEPGSTYTVHVNDATTTFVASTMEQ